MPTDASLGIQQLAANSAGQHQSHPKQHSLEMQPRSAQPRAVDHIPQQYSWDCGLACVLMVLRALGCTTCDFHTLRRLSRTTSVWTVDLAYLLAHFGASVTFCTITIGINDDYANEWFYMEHLEHDEARVQQLFKQADKLGITVQQRSVPLAELVAAVGSGQQLAILLVDRRKIDPWQAAADMAWNYTTGVTSATSYTGHYILLVGYEPPACAAKTCAGTAGLVATSAAGAGGSSSASSTSSSNSSNSSSSTSTSTSASACSAMKLHPAAPREAAGQQQQQGAAQRDLQADAAAFLVSNCSRSGARSSGNDDKLGATAAAAAGEPPGHSRDADIKALEAAARLGYFWVQDPAHSHGPTRVPVAIVESARKSFGTDEDLLLVEIALPLAPRCRAAAAPAPAAACSENSSWCAAAAAAAAAAGAFAPTMSLQDGFQQQQQQQQAPDEAGVDMWTQQCRQHITQQAGLHQLQQEVGLEQCPICNSAAQPAAGAVVYRPELFSCSTGAGTGASCEACISSGGRSRGA